MNADNHQNRLYLSLPPLALDQLEAVTQMLDRLTSRIDIACVNLALGERGGSQSPLREQQQLKALIADLQKKNIAVLADLTSSQYQANRKSFEKALENAQITGCDGLHLSADMGLFERAREVFGADAIIGVDCGNSRHAAMQIGELGADYVGFGAPHLDYPDEQHPVEHANKDQDHDLNKANPEHNGVPFETMSRLDLTDWWQQLFEVPCVALDVADRSQIEDLQKISADFIAIGPGLWSALLSDDELLNWLATQYPIAETKA